MEGPQAKECGDLQRLEEVTLPQSFQREPALPAPDLAP